MKRTLFIFAALLAFSGTIFSENTENPTEILKFDLEKILDEMCAENCYMGAAVGEASEKPLQYERYEKLRDSASKNELVSLLSDKNGVVRAYALQSLIERNEKIDWEKIALDSLSDTEKIETLFCCIGLEECVGDIFLDMLKDKISPETQEKIDLLLLKNRSPLYHARELLSGDKKSAELYALTREWALEGNEHAIFALAKYQNADDYPLILSLKDREGKSLFFAACPYILNDSLKPFFSDYMDSILPSKYWSGEWRGFYKSLALFKDEFAKIQLHKVFSSKANKNIRKYHLEFMTEALAEYDDGFYDDILFEMWEKYDAVNLAATKNLYAHDKDRTLRCMKNALNNAKNYFSKTETLGFCIETLLDEKIDIRKSFVKNLPHYSVFVFEEFFKYIDRFADESTDKALLKRLKTEENGHIAIPIYKYFASRKDAAINQELVKIYGKNKKSYMEWTEKAIRNLLEECGAM